MLKFLPYLLCILLFLSSCFDLIGPGSSKLISLFSSPSRKRKAVLFLKQSSLSEDSQQISIIDENAILDSVAVGNIFTCDDNHGKVLIDSNTLRVDWITDDTLQIGYDKRIRPFYINKEFDGVIIRYRTF